MNEITIGDKIYISSKRAAEVTGYAKDYVGQLCREGHVDAKMVGRSWYVYEPSIRRHRFGEEAVQEEQSSNMPAQMPEPVNDVVELAKEQLVQAPEPVVETSSVHSTTTWNEPTYTSEEPQELPELQTPAYEELLPPAEETITDMQQAWKEWFDRKQETLHTPEIESPEIIDERAEAVQVQDEEEVEDLEETEEETEVPMHRIEEDDAREERREDVHEPEVAAERVAIHHIAAPTPVYERRTEHAETVFTRRSMPAKEHFVQEREVEHTGRIIEERIVKVASKGGTARPVRKQKGSYSPVVALLIGVSVIAIAIAAIGTGYVDSYIAKTNLGNPIINFLVGTREYIR